MKDYSGNMFCKLWTTCCLIVLLTLNLSAQSIDISGSCIEGSISLTVDPASPIDGKTTYSGIGDLAGFTSVAMAIFWSDADQTWYLAFDGQPYFAFAEDSDLPPNNNEGNWQKLGSENGADPEVCPSGDALSITGDGTQPLPVHLISFNLDMKESTIDLKWKVASETNNEGFNILRSADLLVWESLGFIDGSGTTANTKTYTFIDQEPMSGISYYRLKQVDWDGRFEYSRIIKADFAPNPITLYPNPSSGLLNLNWPDKWRWESAEILDLSGRVIHQFVPSKTANVGMLTRGMYWLKLKSTDSKFVLKKFVFE